LSEHYSAVRLCADALIQHRWAAPLDGDGEALFAVSATLRRALGMAMQRLDSVNMVRWESEACELERQAEALEVAIDPPPFDALALFQASGWQMPTDQPWHFADPWAGIALAGQAVWRGCGLRMDRDRLTVLPNWPQDWSWWALLDLPVNESKLSLLWDGQTLYATQPVRTGLPLQIVEQITALKTEEHDFDLQFEVSRTVDGEVQRHRFKPQFLQS
jgi:hypothetical protein